uniref:Helicase ATP-binding domain-containing protein n=1 Tax=Chromera velia CCMP2878 TaxID=1169474 RepID=A0A0G4HYH6_9ALVE|eukprot:Cvel_9502.t1-p1 / transcript=Cvel_9502.t1 / gene=Cvel_9502 / organism=Chromera_velia_CCMP2878 / gene_product=SWI/SNF-related matrix-associated actin-dependent, putative / transcript_product=SWI/SNF-related matrix-associated actin-dependent, putative / location=Cvel_scaffold549:29727-38966(+) / protein_length=1079 / sequence_SO=supercontig / SO=protein_coding / is_pseudo=false
MQVPAAPAEHSNRPPLQHLHPTTNTNTNLRPPPSPKLNREFSAHPTGTSGGTFDVTQLFQPSNHIPHSITDPEPPPPNQHQNSLRTAQASRERPQGPGMPPQRERALPDAMCDPSRPPPANRHGAPPHAPHRRAERDGPSPASSSSASSEQQHAARPAPPQPAQQPTIVPPPIPSPPIMVEGTLVMEVISPTQFKLLHRTEGQNMKQRISPYVPAEVFKNLRAFGCVRGQNNANVFPAAAYIPLLEWLRKATTCNVEGAPAFVLVLFPLFRPAVASFNAPRKTAEILRRCLHEEQERQGNGPVRQVVQDPNQEWRPEIPVSVELKNKLYGFQRAGVDFALEKGGRVLIGDEMGLGKTVQALMVAAANRDIWPFLVVCPSSLRLQWRAAAEEWLGELLVPPKVVEEEEEGDGDEGGKRGASDLRNFFSQRMSAVQSGGAQPSSEQANARSSEGGGRRVRGLSAIIPRQRRRLASGDLFSSGESETDGFEEKKGGNETLLIEDSSDGDQQSTEKFASASSVNGDSDESDFDPDGEGRSKKRKKKQKTPPQAKKKAKAKPKPKAKKAKPKKKPPRYNPYHVGNIFVVKDGKATVPEHAQMIIISYDLYAAQQKFRQTKYKVMIADESHNLKNHQAKRTQAIVPLLQEATVSLLLSGTPALNKPSELHAQLDALMPRFSPAWDFSVRYCEQKLNPFRKGKGAVDFTHGKHTEELNLFLTRTVLVRRLKRDVLTELPSKRRARVPAEVRNLSMLEQIRDLMEQKQDLDEERKQGGGDGDDFQQDDIKKTANSVASQLWQLTGVAKVDFAWDYVKTLAEAAPDEKMLVFAHHQDVLNFLEEAMDKESRGHGPLKSRNYVRIDGKTSDRDREARLKLFTEREDYTIAFLSLTACGTGLNLQCASSVVFAELHWTPAVLLQAEARVDRIGSKHAFVEYHYLIAEGTLDEPIFQLIQRKQEVLGETLDGQKGTMEAQLVSSRVPKGGMGAASSSSSSSSSSASSSAAAASSSSASHHQQHRAPQGGVPIPRHGGQVNQRHATGVSPSVQGSGGGAGPPGRGSAGAGEGRGTRRIEEFFPMRRREDPPG